MPGPYVHFRLTMALALEAGMTESDAEAIGRADILVDDLWPGHTHWWLHFNPAASVVFAPLELWRAVRAARSGDRGGALTHLGRSLHMRQDAVGHGRFGLNHMLMGLGLLGRDPDVWETMPPTVQTRIERATRRALRSFAHASAPNRPVR
jgi:hypothetical protein